MTRVAVVGAGVVGGATAWALRERGADVTVYEQFEQVEHERGSSHGRTRIFRLAYPQEEWVRLAEEALAGWRELGGDVLALHGLVELAPARELTSADALARCGAEFSFDPPDERVRVPAGWTALWQPAAGVVHADRARRALLDGVDVRTGVRVDEPAALDADAVVLAVGAWIRRFAADVPVRVTRETVAYFRHDGPPLPSVVELNARRGHAMYALHDPMHGLKAGVHFGGAESDPDETGEPEPALVERIAAWVAERFPAAEPEPAAAQACLYTSTADESFVLERRGRLVVGSACSGHGFKFAPAVGRRLADLALR
ncbi:MAG TPA: FAD-dependent oxidoreductase [Gaiellaceae bacterium]|nr:FAD-dependent oxidoreductase [Gaiellaceae bacterium]